MIYDIEVLPVSFVEDYFISFPLTYKLWIKETGYYESGLIDKVVSKKDNDTIFNKYIKDFNRKNWFSSVVLF
jgi:hypothetical protein